MEKLTLSPALKRTLAILALVFGAITLFKSGSVLFGPDSAREAVGLFVPFVVKFNFFAGFLYVLAGVGIWLERGWAYALSALIALTTLLVAAAFVWHVSQGGGFEMQTVGALIIRASFWLGITLVLRRIRR